MDRREQNSATGRRGQDLETPLVTPAHFGVLLATIAAFGFFMALALDPNCDVVVLLHEAGRVLDGSRLYVDILEINPPLIIYLNLPVAAAGRAIGVSPQALFPFVAFALVLGCLALCNRLRSGLPAGMGQAAVLLSAFTLLVAVGGMFGQREHLMLALILPYAFASAIISEGGKVRRALALGTGVMAGIGFALKPYFVPAFLGVELYLAARRGSGVLARPQARAIWAFFLIYAAAVLLITPDYLPYAWSFRNAYRGYHPHGADVLRRYSAIPGLLAVAVVVSTVVVRRGAKGWSDVFCLLGLLLTAGVYVQAKGFLYHWYPTLALALVLLGVAATATATGFSRPVLRASPEVVLALLVPALCSVAVAFWSAALSADRDVELDRAVRDHGRGGSIFAISSMTHPLCIAGRNGVGWATDHYSLLAVQAYYGSSGWRPGGYHDWGRMPAGEQQLISRFVTDLEEARPALLLVDTLPPSPELIGFDFLDYFRREPRFPRVLAGYRHLADFRRFRVYERIGPAPNRDVQADAGGHRPAPPSPHLDIARFGANVSGAHDRPGSGRSGTE